MCFWGAGCLGAILQNREMTPKQNSRGFLVPRLFIVAVDLYVKNGLSVPPLTPGQYRLLFGEIKIFPRDLDVEAMVKIHPGHHVAVGGVKASLDLEAKFLDSLERVEGLADKNLRGAHRHLRLFGAGDVVEKTLPDPCPAFLVLDAGIDRNELGPRPRLRRLLWSTSFIRKVYHVKNTKQDDGRRLEKTFSRYLPVAV